MTDKEMAEEYAYNKWPDYPEKQEIAEQAFLAGLKAGRPQWHNLKENPEDLPKVKEGKPVGGEPLYHISNVVQNQKGQHCWYNYKYNKWCNSDYVLDEVIAWCEIPTFNKE